MESTMTAPVNVYPGLDNPRRTVIAKRTSNSSNKKQRGRPRVEPRDETAADRRRTQIRLAQRTYRARKESTIAFLEGKVARLENVVHQASATMQDLYQLAQNEQLARTAPFLFHELARAVVDTKTQAEEEKNRAECEEMQDTVKYEDFDSSRGPYQHPTPPSSEGSGQEDQPVHAQTTSSSFDLTTSASQPLQPLTTSSTGVRGVPCVLGYEFVYEQPPHAPLSVPAITHAPPMSDMPATPAMYGPLQPYNPYQQQFQQTTPVTDSPDSRALDHLGALAELPLPNSFAFRESTFGRFLQRACLEYAFRVVSSPASGPDEINKIFAHSLKHATLPQIEGSLRSRLAAGVQDDLSSKNYYPANDGDGSDLRIVTNPDGSRSQLSEGPWLRPEEVELFLASKGLRFHPGLETAELESESVTELPQTPVTSVTWNGHPPQPFFAPQSFTGAPTSAPFHASAPNPAHTFHTGRAGTSGYTPGPPSNLPHAVAPTHQRRRKRITINVAQLVKELVSTSSCRGKTPAVLNKNVKRAVESSITAIATC